MSVVRELLSHPRANCPASTKESAKCHKRKNYPRVCRSTQAPAVREVTQSADQLNEDQTADFGGVFLGELSEEETTARDTVARSSTHRPRSGRLQNRYGRRRHGKTLIVISNGVSRAAFEIFSSALGYALTVIGKVHDALHCVDRTGFS